MRIKPPLSKRAKIEQRFNEAQNSLVIQSSDLSLEAIASMVKSQNFKIMI